MAVNQNFKESTVSTSNHTQNYDLPLWTEGDKTSWLTQVNDAMNKIDSGMVDAKSKALEVVGIAADAKKLAEETSAESKESAKIVAGYNDRLTAVEATSVEHTNDITALNTRCDQMDVEIHSVKETQKKTTEDLGTLADQVKHNKEDADATKQSVSVLNGNVVELTGRVTTCEDDIEALKVTTAANTKNIAQAEENVATVTGKVTALETEVGEVSAATQSNTTAISAINASIESIKSKDTVQDGKIATNTTEISSLDGRVTALEDGGSSGPVRAIVRNGLSMPAGYRLGFNIVVITQDVVYLSAVISWEGSSTANQKLTLSFNLSGEAYTKMVELLGEDFSLWGPLTPVYDDSTRPTRYGSASITKYTAAGGGMRIDFNLDTSYLGPKDLKFEVIGVVGKGEN